MVLDLRAEMAELAAVEAESIGWTPLREEAYLHLCKPDALEINVVGVPEVGMNVLFTARQDKKVST